MSVRKFPNTKSIRQHFGLTQAEFADALSIHRNAVYKWERPGPDRAKPSRLAQRAIQDFLKQKADEHRKAARLRPGTEDAPAPAATEVDDEPLPSSGVVPGLG